MAHISYVCQFKWSKIKSYPYPNVLCKFQFQTFQQNNDDDDEEEKAEKSELS